MEEDNLMIVIREFDPRMDRESVESVERMCEVGPSGKISLFTDLMGDPLCRIRHSPSYLMLVLQPSCYHAILLFFINLRLISDAILVPGGRDNRAIEGNSRPGARLCKDRHLWPEAISPEKQLGS